MRTFITGLAIFLGMLVASVFMAAAPSQAYAPPTPVRTVVQHKTMYGIHAVPFARRCYVNARTGQVVSCNRWHQTSMGVNLFGSR